MNDCRATLHLLSLTLPLSGRPILPSLLENARRRVWRIWAIDAPFELMDRLEARGYRWSNGEDGRPKAWFRDVDDADLVAEEQFLADDMAVSRGTTAAGPTSATASASGNSGRPRRRQPGSSRSIICLTGRICLPLCRK